MIARALVALLGAGFFLTVAPGLASAAPAYPIHHCNVTVTPPSGQVPAGGTFQVSGSYYISTNWTVQFNGQTRTFIGATFSTTLQVPKVTHNETLTLRVSCSAEPGGFSAFRIQISAALLNGGGGKGHLPNTGGPSIWWLIAGALAGIIGSTLMWRGRRRRDLQQVVVSPGKHLRT